MASRYSIPSERRSYISNSILESRTSSQWQGKKIGGLALSKDIIKLFSEPTAGYELGTTMFGFDVYRMIGRENAWQILTVDEVRRGLRSGQLRPLHGLADLTKLAEEMTTLKAKLGQAKLFKTMRLMDRACKAVGYEIADMELRSRR